MLALPESLLLPVELLSLAFVYRLLIVLGILVLYALAIPLPAFAQTFPLPTTGAAMMLSADPVPLVVCMANVTAIALFGPTFRARCRPTNRWLLMALPDITLLDLQVSDATVLFLGVTRNSCGRTAFPLAPLATNVGNDPVRLLATAPPNCIAIAHLLLRLVPVTATGPAVWVGVLILLSTWHEPVVKLSLYAPPMATSGLRH